MAKEKLYSVYSNLERVVTITSTPAKDKTDFVKFHFMPGDNFVAEQIYKAIKNEAMFKELVALGRKGFEVLDSTEEVFINGNVDDKRVIAAAMATIPAKELIDKIKGVDGKDGILDIELLHLMKGHIDKVTVLRAIDEQYEKLQVKK